LDFAGDLDMHRFFFDLVGRKVITDEHGLMFADVLLASRVAEKLAADLSSGRPDLRGSASVIVSDGKRNEFTYCVAIK